MTFEILENRKSLDDSLNLKWDLNKAQRLKLRKPKLSVLELDE